MMANAARKNMEQKIESLQGENAALLEKGALIKSIIEVIVFVLQKVKDLL